MDKQKQLEEISSKIKDLSPEKIEWANLILEAAGILNSKEPKKIYEEALEGFKKDFGSKTLNFGFIEGYIGGLEFSAECVKNIFPFNVAFTYTNNLTRAILIKYKQILLN